MPISQHQLAALRIRCTTQRHWGKKRIGTEVKLESFLKFFRLTTSRMGMHWYSNHRNEGALLISNCSVGLIKWKHLKVCKAEFCISVFEILLIHTLKRKAYNHKGTLKKHIHQQANTYAASFISPQKQRISHLSYWHCKGYTEELKDHTKPRLLIHTGWDLKARLHEWKLRSFSVAA